MAKTRINEIRARIAPSPTGYLHIGTARTALFNWLFAKKNSGKFILRIEDTDLERSDPVFEKDLIDNLKWLGLDWDEGPAPSAGGKIRNPKSEIRQYVGNYGSYRQSERLETYEKYINQLLENGLAYYCFCSKEELEIQRQAMLSQGLAPKYSGQCRGLNSKEINEKLKTGAPRIIRFKIPETKISFTDLIRGEITFDGALIGDITIAKNPRTPLYNFAVVVDDYTMKISHVIRGEDHLANTPKQIFIQKALGFPQPEYAHLPLILDPDRSKMSKRYSATAIKEYRDQGYLPEALINFMALLGWHPPTDQEIFTREELMKNFDLARVQKAGAVFNIEKLNWINAQYIKRLTDEKLAELLKTKNLKIVSLIRERMKKISDFQELAGFFFKLPEYKADLLIWKDVPKTLILENLKEVEKNLKEAAAKNFTRQELERRLMILTERRGRGEILWPLRAALSGQDASPGPFEIADALGKRETLNRIKIAIKKLG